MWSLQSNEIFREGGKRARCFGGFGILFNDESKAILDKG